MLQIENKKKNQHKEYSLVLPWYNPTVYTLILNITILRSGAMQVVFIKCKSCKSDNVFQCNVFNFKNKRQTGYKIILIEMV